MFLQLKIEVRSFETEMGQLETNKCHHLERLLEELYTFVLAVVLLHIFTRAVQKNFSDIILANLQSLKEYGLIFWNVACIFTVKTLSLVKFASPVILCTGGYCERKLILYAIFFSVLLFVCVYVYIWPVFISRLIHSLLLK